MLAKIDFPIFKNNPNLVYLDAAATAQKPLPVIRTVSKYYESYNANVHRSSYKLGVQSTSLFENSRNSIAGLFGVKNNEIVFTSGATQGLNILALGLKKYIKTGDNIVISALEHHSNLLPWRALAREKKAEIRVIKIINGRIDLKDAKEKINERTKIVAVAHASNVFGTVQPIEKISRIAKKNNAILIVDGAQAVAHLTPHKQTPGVCLWGVDAYVFSGHKAYGPTGIGVLIITNQLAQKIAPVFYGGEMVDFVDDKSERYAGLPQVLEAGTPNISGAIGLAKGLEILYSDPENFEYLNKLNIYLKAKLSKINNIELYSPVDCELPIISFNIKGYEAKKISSILDDYYIAVRAGYLCAEPLVRSLSATGVVRVSLGLWNTKKDVDKLIKVLKDL